MNNDAQVVEQVYLDLKLTQQLELAVRSQTTTPTNNIWTRKQELNVAFSSRRNKFDQG